MRVRLAWYQSTNKKTRVVGAAVALVVKVIVAELTFSPLLPRFLSKAIAPGLVPVPLSVTLCGVPVALSEIETLAERPPVADGENVAEIVHVAFGASVAGLTGHVFVCAKSPAFVPVIPTLETSRGAVPLFLSVVVCAALLVPTVWEPNDRPVGVSVTAGAVPVPLSAIACGLFDASSVTETAAVKLPDAAGLKVTEIVQVALTASVAGLVGQLLLCAYAAALAPVKEMPEIVSGAVPVFWIVADCATLLVPTCCEPNVRLDGATVTAGAAAVPLPASPALCEPPAALSATWTLAVRGPGAPGVNLTKMVHVALTASVAGASGQVFDCA